jgi:putative transposase
MPRRPRILLPDYPLHIVQRGINREPCFFAEEDYQCYLHWLEEAARDCGCAIHAYADDQPCPSAAHAGESRARRRA